MENIINLDTLKLGKHHFNFHLDGAYLQGLEKSELLGGDVEAKAELNLVLGGFELKMEVNGTVQVACARCLEPMNLEIAAEDDMTTDAEDEITEKKRGQLIDLNWLAYELIIVNLPIVHSHQPGGCNQEMDILLQNHLCTQEDPEA